MLQRFVLIVYNYVFYACLITLLLKHFGTILQSNNLKFTCALLHCVNVLSIMVCFMAIEEQVRRWPILAKYMEVNLVKNCNVY